MFINNLTFTYSAIYVKKKLSIKRVTDDCINCSIHEITFFIIYVYIVDIHYRLQLIKIQLFKFYNYKTYLLAGKKIKKKKKIYIVLKGN